MMRENSVSTLTDPSTDAVFDISPYELVPMMKMGSRATAKPRLGALIRVTFQDGAVGYGDCFPWPELGDETLDQQLESIQARKWTALTSRTLEFARIDAVARMNHQSLFESLVIPQSHALMTDFAQFNSETLFHLSQSGYRKIKLKVGANPLQEAALLKDHHLSLRKFHLQLRLDFNASLSLEQMHKFMEEIREGIQDIDFIEDPFPYDPQGWREVQEKWKIRLALDRIVSNKPWHKCWDELKNVQPGSFSVLIIKPAVQDPLKMLQMAKNFKASVVVTSYLDHPFGQLCAAWSAAQIQSLAPDRVETCGLLSHTAYQPHPFSRLLSVKGETLYSPSDPGFGFGEMLSMQEWKPLSSTQS